jgi:hypothetical protein
MHHWQILEGLIQILHPFKEATNDCQKDKATMYTFYNAFIKMKNKMKQKVNDLSINNNNNNQ